MWLGSVYYTGNFIWTGSVRKPGRALGNAIIFFISTLECFNISLTYATIQMAVCLVSLGWKI